MNGGIHHALEIGSERERLQAADGYRFFGLDGVAALLLRADEHPILSRWTDETEHEGDRLYARLVPDDSTLVRMFEAVFARRLDEFAPLQP